MSDSFASVKFLLEKSRTEQYFDTERKHLCYELVYCKQGSGYFCINGINVPFKEGTFAIFPPSYSISETGSNAMCYYLGFEYNNFLGDLSYGIFDDETGEFLRIIENMQAEVQNHHAYSDNCLEAYIKILIYTVKRKWEKSLSPSTPQASTVLSDIIEYFNQNYGKKINVTEYFESIGYSYHHLRHSFKEVYGMSPNQYLMKIRVDAAKKLLLTTQLSFEEIQTKCGFNSQSHFITNFKKFTQKSPAELRKERS